MDRYQNINISGPSPELIRRRVDEFFIKKQQSHDFVAGELMRDQKFQIGVSLKIGVQWYDQVPEPPKLEWFEGEITGWRSAMLIVRIKDYAVVRFWKRNGLEVGNKDYERRGFKVDLSELEKSVRAAREGVEVNIDGEVPALPQDPQ
jgi:hypothetical protein